MNTRRTPTLEDVPPDDRAALIRFRDANGRYWKEALNNHWMFRDKCDHYVEGERFEDGPALRRIRNSLGPLWLAKV